MNKQQIHIVHVPTGMLLCGDGVFRSGVTSCFRKDDTLFYRSIGHALRRLNTNKPGQKIRSDLIDDVVLDVVEANYGTTTGKTYRMDRHRKIVA